MGKRSNFERKPQDAYDTWDPNAVAPLVPHLPAHFTYIEPCAGRRALIEHLPGVCVWASDIEPRGPDVVEMDWLDAAMNAPDADFCVTNPPWRRDILHEMLSVLRVRFTTWLLLDADWMHTVQAGPHLRFCRKIVSVGRVKWEPDSKYSGKDNCAWYRFERDAGPIEFVGRA